MIRNALILATPLVAAAIAQIIKISIRNQKQSLKLKDFFKFTYSGMPSGHSSLIISLVTIIGLTEGYGSPVFALAVVFALIVINDALRLRRYLGQHGEILNVLVRDLKDDNVLDEKYPHLLENIGHTPIQVLAGSLIGATVSVLAWWLFY